ncbi:Tubulin polyglutamylase ttll5 [Nowakowskiella sp. JEL0407]|nr:Tubulin polyglutamylase ttll5 [Nowakowskiella sp. JEL0407]
MLSTDHSLSGKHTRGNLCHSDSGITDISTTNRDTDALRSDTPFKYCPLKCVSVSEKPIRLGIPQFSDKSKLRFEPVGYNLSRKEAVQLMPADQGTPFTLNYYMSPEIECRNQKINRFPKSLEIARKERLYLNVLKLKEAHPNTNGFDFLPITFLLPQQYSEFYGYFMMNNGRWRIEKIGSKANNVQIIESLAEIPPGITNVNEKKEYIIQRMVNDTMLFHGSKFELRLFVAVTSFSPLRIYTYDEGLIRYLEPDGRNSDSYFALLHYIEVIYGPNCKNSLIQKMQDIIIKTFISIDVTMSTALRMFVPNSNNCFELFSFDFVIDDGLVPYLMDVNIAPSLSCSEEFDLTVKSNLIADLLTLIGIVPATTPYKQSIKKGRVFNTRKSNSEKDWTQASDNNHAQLQSFLMTIYEEKSRCGHFSIIFPVAASASNYSKYFRKTSINFKILSHLARKQNNSTASAFTPNQNQSVKSSNIKSTTVFLKKNFDSAFSIINSALCTLPKSPSDIQRITKNVTESSKFNESSSTRQPSERNIPNITISMPLVQKNEKEMNESCIELNLKNKDDCFGTEVSIALQSTSETRLDAVQTSQESDNKDTNESGIADQFLAENGNKRDSKHDSHKTTLSKMFLETALTTQVEERLGIEKICRWTGTFAWNDLDKPFYDGDESLTSETENTENFSLLTLAPTNRQADYICSSGNNLQDSSANVIKKQIPIVNVVFDAFSGYRVSKNKFSVVSPEVCADTGYEQVLNLANL